MFKVLKNLEQSWIAVIFIVLLLIIQATCDLTLPDYTSKIINVGIQNGGIEDVVPEEIRKSTMDYLLLFTNEDETILDSYEEKENRIYKIKKVSKEEKENLNNIMAKPLVIINYLNDEEMSKQIKAQVAPNTPNAELIDIIKQMPEEQREQVISSIDEQLNKMQDSIMEQVAIQVVKKEYQAIGINTDTLQNKYIIISGLKMLLISLIIMISAISIMCLSSIVSARLGKILREKIFKKVLSFSNKEFSEYSTASLITRSTNDIQQIQNLIAILFRVVVYAPIIGIGGFLRVLANSDTSMAWIIGFAILCVIAIVLVLFIVAMPKFKVLQNLVDKLNLVSREILTGLPVIKAFNTSKREEERFDSSNKDLMKANIFVNRAMSIMMPALMFVMNSIMLLIIWVGGHKVDEGIMQVGDMMAFIQYTMQIVMSFLMISMISIMLPRAAVSANRINEVLEKHLSIANKEKIKRFKEDKKGLVEFKNVCFRYPDADEEMLTDINFTAKPGETTAIIGSTGSGKSTIVNLLPRFYDVTRGELLIDGTNIKDVEVKELRKKIGFVPQKGILFSGTIKSNIKYGNPEMSDENMIKAAKIAQAEEFILAKEEKYDSPIAQGGNNVSGGQKQRLSIARAIAISPEILVFDDSFSALDLKTDKALREALAKEVKGKTVIIVAQRISTIMNAEQIVVLEEGKVVGKGTHEELMKTCETYKQIAISQLSEEELNGNNSKEVD